MHARTHTHTHAHTHIHMKTHIEGAEAMPLQEEPGWVEVLGQQVPTPCVCVHIICMYAQSSCMYIHLHNLYVQYSTVGCEPSTTTEHTSHREGTWTPDPPDSVSSSPRQRWCWVAPLGPSSCGCRLERRAWPSSSPEDLHPPPPTLGTPPAGL